MLNIINELGVTENVSVVRFFKVNNANYLMYTLNEKDEAGYIKLFAAKMLDASTFSKIEDEEEWSSIKETIKLIVKEAKENALVSVEDLDFTKLNEIKILGTRIFKLNETVVEILGSNKKEFKEEPVKTESIPILSIDADEIFNVDFKMFPNKTNDIEKTVASKEDYKTLDDSEPEAQSFEELLAQSAPKLEELVFETPIVEKPVVTTTIETPVVPTMEPTKKLSTLEELLGQYTEEPVVAPIVEEKKAVTNNDSETIKKLETKVIELETKLAKIKEILQ